MQTFKEVCIKAVEVVDTLGIEPIQIPILSGPPKRYIAETNQHILLWTSIELSFTKDWTPWTGINQVTKV